MHRTKQQISHAVNVAAVATAAWLGTATLQPGVSAGAAAFFLALAIPSLWAARKLCDELHD